MAPKLKCPTCKKPAAWENNPFRPFCSERCKLVDLGKWSDGSYSVPGETTSPIDHESPDPSELIN